ncbi:MAG TPA: hypothetical protein DIW47_02090 [Bacteroidetes bacterium]|nr:hypothetical protein [Bacteroidota bacterium]
MKPVTLVISLSILVLITLSGCYKDVIMPDIAVDPDGPPQAVSFSTDLAPLFDASCTDVGCHVSGAHKPYLTLDVSYQQIVNGGYVNTEIPKQSTLYIMINGEMREYMPSAADRQKVYDWIRNGAPNN